MMDSIIDKLLEAIKDKMSKKQIIAIVGMVILAVMKPMTKIELAVAGCVTLIVLVGVSCQTYLDKGVKNETTITSYISGSDTADAQSVDDRLPGDQPKK